MTTFLKNNRHYLLLIVLLTALFIPLAIAGLDLGFVGDSLGFEQSFTELGLRGGMRYTLLWDRRHLLSGQFYAALHILFPGQSAAWYGSSLLFQFALAPVIFLLCNAILKGKYRWVSFAAALIAVFHTRQIVSDFEIPTSGHNKLGIILSVLGLYAYLRFVRGERRNFLWRDFSVAFYILGVLLHEVAVLFFFVNPLIAYFEERDKPGFRIDWRWLVQLVKDSVWYPVLFLLYFYLLTMLLPPSVGGRQISVSPVRMIEQFLRGLQGEFAPANLSAQIAPALQGNGLLLTLLVTAGLGALIYWLWRSDAEQRVTEDRRLALLIIGIALVVLNIAGVAPQEYALNDPYHSPRLTIPSAIGIGMILAAGLSLLLDRFPARRVIFAGVVGLLVALGVTRIIQVQQDYIVQHNAITEISSAMLQAVPAVSKDKPPYFLIMADAQHNDAIHSRDLRFPLFFDMLYKEKGSAADGVYADSPADQAPASDQKGADYHGPDIIIEPDAIYSPLNPGVPIDRSRLIILQYDSATRTAHVVPELHAADLSGTNVIVRGDAPLVSNLSLVSP